ncbi:MAG TPA: sugar ABC transporter substrate-binding protein, partial [Ktedonobacteraceae bacterium]|nr:sugar ABC transporter substrate-binding protein [Ktedonobacteraceae bacterium]
MQSKFASRLRALAALVVITTVLAACGGTSGGTSGSTTSGGKLAPGASFKLGVSLTFNNTDFWTNYITYEKMFAAKYNATLIGPLVANNNAAQQNTDIHTLIQEGAQALIVNPVDSAAIAPALDYAASKNIPVVSVDVAPSSGKVFMIVRADNVAYGKNSCKYIATHATTSSGHIAILEGDLASLNGQDRSNGCKQEIQQNYPNFKVVEYPTKWDTPTAVNDAKTALSTYSDLRGIYVEWSAP